jgi:hypothetical protein
MIMVQKLNFIKFLVELFRKMMIIMFFSCEIANLNVMVSPYVIIYDFLVVKIQTIPLSLHIYLL